MDGTRRLNVYFAGSIRGGTFEDKEQTYQVIVAAIRKNHNLLSEHAAALGKSESAVMNDADIYKRDIKWLNGSHVMIAEVSAPSIGVGYEIGYAGGIPILCLHHSNIKPSAMISGNTDLIVRAYSSLAELVDLVAWFLDKVDKGEIY